MTDQPHSHTESATGSDQTPMPVPVDAMIDRLHRGLLSDGLPANVLLTQMARLRHDTHAAIAANKNQGRTTQG